MFRRLTLALILCLLPAVAFGQLSEVGKASKTITDADIVGDVVFSADTIYTLDGFVFVDDGESLTIEPGTIIKALEGQGNDASALIVSIGGYIDAQGTKELPIIFTSVTDDVDDNADIPAGDLGRGLWGGLVLLGDAPINTTAGVGNIEGLPASARTEYGGNDENDNSGILTYVSVRHGGSVFGTADEINGITLGGVGAGTTIEYVEVTQNLDDGIEWFGGTVNVRYAVVSFCGDDMFDIDEGFSGAGQFWFGIMDTDAGDNAGEHDGGTTPEDGLPYATPLISNVTYLGSGYDLGTAVNPQVFNIRDNCSPAYFNSIFSDINGAGLAIEDLGSGEDSDARLAAGDLVFQNNAWGLFNAGYSPADLAVTSNAEVLFTTAAFDNWVVNPGIFVSRLADGNNDPRPLYASTLPNWTTPTAYDPPAKPGFGATKAGFFETVDYIGAFDPDADINDLWTTGWTAFDFYGYQGSAAKVPSCNFTDNGKPEKTITDADIVGTLTFSADTVYVLDGFVFVDSGEVLYIEPGTIIKALEGQGNDASALIVSQDGILIAQGTPDCPIVMTTETDDIDDNADIPADDLGRGLWGGLVLLGNATINTTAGIGNIEGLPASPETEYGGNDDLHNSGSLHYVSVRHGGSVFGTADEINGITLGGVGQNTDISHVEVFQNLDDGIEWFGGTVRMKHVVVAFCGDDMYDIDEGFSGGGQYFFGIMAEDAGDAFGEHDGGTTPEDGIPYATPLFSNVTYLGSGYLAASAANPQGFNIRDNCSPAYYNSIFHDVNGYGASIEVLSAGLGGAQDSENRLLTGDLQMVNNVWGLFNSGNTPAQLAAPGQDSTQRLWTEPVRNNIITDPGIYVSRVADMNNDPRPKNTGKDAQGLPSFTTPTVYDPPAKPGFGADFVPFFDNVEYVGAFDPNESIAENWMQTWTAFDFYGYLGENDGGCGGITDNGKPEKTIVDADITGTVTFSSDTVYVLDGFVFVDAGEVLNIEPGTIIKALEGQGNDASALIVSIGGQIFAPGTKECPIIFTSITDDVDDNADIPAGDLGRGLWGGVVLLGDATINTTAGVGNIEGLPASSRTEYGGSDDDDNSGTMTYCSIRHGGSVFGTADEINGLTLGGVGSSTTLEYIEITQNLDDGIEWFGGTVRVNHLAVTFCGDDMFDIDEGYSGGGQFWFGIMDTDAGDAAGEHDGGTTPEDGTPFATPLISNVTYLGAGYQNPGAVNPQAFNIRDNCSPAYYNSIFHDFNGYGASIEQLTAGLGGTVDSENRLLVGDLVFQNNIWGLFNSGATAGALAAPGQTWTADSIWSKTSTNNAIGDPGIYVSRLADGNNDPRPKALSSLKSLDFPAWTDPTAYDPPAKPGFGAAQAGAFQTVDYLGAFDPNATIEENWLAGWSAFDFYGYLGENDGGCDGVVEAGKPTKTITDADIVGNVTLYRDTVYTLDGFVFVDSGEVLNIEPGTIVKALEGQGNAASALIVSQGGRINARGTETCPIIFTTVTDDVDDPADIPAGDLGRGLWGGVVLLGNAEINTTTGVGNIEGLPASPETEYGGNDNNDNSGCMTYCSIRHGGSVFGTADEINGLTLGGVGQATTLHHIEITQNLDDGIEWFGGNVNVDYLLVTFCGDDMFDIDEGYSGGGQFWFGIMDTDAGDNAGEHDGGTTPEDGAPFATPVITNATYLGAGVDNANAVNPQVFNIRDNCSPAYYNSIFSDVPGSGAVIEVLTTGLGGTVDSETRLIVGDMLFQNNVWGTFAAGNTGADLANNDTTQKYIWDDAARFNVIGDPEIYVSRLPDGKNDPRPKDPTAKAVFPVWTDPTAYDPPAKPGFGLTKAGNFIQTPYIGAFDPNADIQDLWIAGWTAFDFYGYLGVNDGPTDGCCVGETGDVNASGDPPTLTDLTLLVNKLFVTFEEVDCPPEANTSGDPNCDITLTDLTLLVNKLFVTFETLADCSDFDNANCPPQP